MLPSKKRVHTSSELQSSLPYFSVWKEDLKLQRQMDFLEVLMILP